MATSDFKQESELPPDDAPPRVEPPRIVNLPSSFDMMEFPSEAADEPEPAAAAGATVPGIEPPPPATVIDFPSHAPEVTTAAAFTSSTAHAGATTLADMLEERSGIDWRESVAIVHKLCEQLKRRSQRAPVLLEPRNIRVTADGEVTLVSEQLGGDPLVMQIGRLLRTMLMGRHAPPELRLLLAQATFELPIFQSVDEIDEALYQIERTEDARPPLTEIVPFAPAHIPTRPAAVAHDKPIGAPHDISVRAIKPPAPPRQARMRIPMLDRLLENYGASMIASLAAMIAAVALFIAAPSLVDSNGTNGPAERPSVVVRQPAPTTGSAPDPRAGPSDSPIATEVERSSSARVPVDPARSAPIARDGTRGAAPAAVNRRPPPAARERIAGAGRAADTTSPAAASIAPPREAERPTAAANGQGQASDFDGLLLSNPLYEPKASDLPPESLTAFRSRQRLLLPVLAQRGYDRAKAALASGDVDRALAAARETAAILERPAAAPAAHLRDDVRRLLEDAGTAKATADEVVYTRTDAGVVAPRPISRQFPATTPNGVPANRVGTLEMIVGKDGTVEFVKLHTPLNRYHERMIVSAAKAWLYRPATRGGRPVRYRLTVTINLPENGTY
jgi:hypothetical protein